MLQSIEQFYYRHYLKNHLNRTNRILHFMANLVIIMSVIRYFLFGDALLMVICVISGYSLALVGHIFFEKNLPVIVKHPFMALAGDIWMFWRMASGRINEDLKVYKDYL